MFYLAETPDGEKYAVPVKDIVAIGKGSKNTTYIEYSGPSGDGNTVFYTAHVSKEIGLVVDSVNHLLEKMISK